MNKTLFLKEWKTNWKLLILFMAVLTLYAGIIIMMFDPKLGESLNLMAESMPQLFAAFGMMHVGSTLVEFIANYLYGFLLIAFPVVLILLLGHRLLTRYIDSGSMAWLLSAGISRKKILMTQLFFFLFTILLLNGYLTGLILLLSEFFFPDELDLICYFRLAAGLLALHGFLAALCFFCVCCFADTRFADGAGAALIIASLLLQMLSQVGDQFEFLRYLTLLTLFDPQKLLSDPAGALWGPLILLFTAGGLSSMAVHLFVKKDLSL